MFMPLSDKILGLVIAVVVCAIFGFIIYILVKKQNERVAEIVNSLTDEQKEKLINASLDNCSLTLGLIAAEPKVKTNKTALNLLVYNMYYPNQMKQFIPADISISKEQYNAHNLKQGDYIKISLNENGAKAIF